MALLVEDNLKLINVLELELKLTNSIIVQWTKAKEN